MAASINEHRVLMDAFVQRDAARAERAMHDHLMAQLVALKKLLQTARAPGGRHPRPGTGADHAR
jgi:DNA-binding GntR family transcriptional regulator